MDGWDPIVDITAFNVDRFSRAEQAESHWKIKTENTIEIQQKLNLK